jgi:hypothetical protein
MWQFAIWTLARGRKQWGGCKLSSALTGLFSSRPTSPRQPNWKVAILLSCKNRTELNDLLTNTRIRQTLETLGLLAKPVRSDKDRGNSTNRVHVFSGWSETESTRYVGQYVSHSTSPEWWLLMNVEQLVEWNGSTRRKPAPVPLCAPQIPHDPGHRGGKPATNLLGYEQGVIGLKRKFSCLKKCSLSLPFCLLNLWARMLRNFDYLVVRIAKGNCIFCRRANASVAADILALYNILISNVV